MTKIMDAPIGENIQVYSLSSESSLDNIHVEPTEARTLLTSENPVKNGEVYEIYVEGKVKPVIKVSGNHPMVDENGHIVLPAEMTAGDKIMPTRGAERVLQVKIVEFDGNYYNVLPISSDLKKSIIVMGDGYLVGSKRIQNKSYSHMLRAFSRETIEIDG